MESKVYDVCGRTDHLVDYIAKALELRLSRGEKVKVLTDAEKYEAVECENKYLGRIHREEFSSHEFMAAYPDSIRGCRVFLVGSTDTSDNIMRMCVAIDAAKRNNAREIVAVIPYMGYSRQDKRDQRDGYHRSSVGAKVHAKMLEAVGVDHVITVDMHAEQIELAFDVSVDHVMMSKMIADAIKDISAMFHDKVEIAVGSPDMGGTKRQSRVMDFLRPQPLSTAQLDKLSPAERDNFLRDWKRGAHFSTVVCSKHRDNHSAGQEVSHMDVIGDVDGKVVVFVDDMFDTGGTAIKAAESVKARGAKAVFYIVTHGLFSGNAAKNMLASDAIDQVMTFDTLNMRERDQWSHSKKLSYVPGYRTAEGTPPNPLEVLSIAPYLAEYMHAIITDTAVTR